MSKQRWSGRGPFRAEQVRSGDPYELSRGHPIVCAPSERERSEPNHLGAAVLGSDVAVNFTAGDGTWATSAARRAPGGVR